nr:TetR/AcrR family transcriptional regulator [Kibdelosporangium sp. MJ126-NF4]CEL13219.1 Transcriptional regulator, TetR family [Kibdelosporangium sp. MJ126-NF4]CTQ98910.1 Transcriptional regulator, TetR family [Kibdelosporangium sp. MJ126-NF4]
MRPRTEAPERRRGDLLDAAQQIVLDKGIAGLTVDEVTSRADVAKGTFYLYFRSKEQLIGALQQRFVNDLTTRQHRELDALADNDWMGRLLHWMESSIRGYHAHADLHDALFLHTSPADHPGHGHLADPATNQHAAALVEILDAGTTAGTFALANPRAAAVLLYNTMHGTADYLIEQGYHRETSSANVDDMITETLNLCRRYVRPDELS